MISGNEVAVRRAPAALLVIALVLFSGGVAAQTAPPPDWGIEQLMQSLGRVKSATGRFVERKHLAILNSPLEFSGILIYTAPGRLEKRILLPEPQTMVLEQDRFTIEIPSRNRSRTLALNDYPIIRAFVESIRSTLAGDLQTLTQYYRINLEGDPDRWRLSLAPSEPAMQAVVREIRISGSKDRVGAIEVIEAQGDRSVTTISGDAP
jgi:hypothetical protein